MPTQKPQVTRYAVFTVSEATKNEYGDLIVKDTKGNEYKIGNKRPQLFDVFQIGAEVKVGYAVYMQKEYIASAEQTGVHIPEVEKVKEAGGQVTRVSISKTDDMKNRAVALSYSKDAWIAGKIEKDAIYKCADYFLQYIENIKNKN